MRQRLNNDPDLCAKLIPNWELGCRRATPGDGYLEALCAENAGVNNTPILRFTESGIQTANEHTEFDIIVCATGFDVSYRPPWTVQGRNGHQLHHAWSDSPEAYFGIAAPNTPNYFIFIGPNSPGIFPPLFTGKVDDYLRLVSGAWHSPRQRILRGEMDPEVVSQDGNGRYQVSTYLPTYLYFEFRFPASDMS